MARIDEDELIEHWTLIGGELAEVAGKRGPTRLAFALLLKFYARCGRFPRGRGELPDEAVAYVARQVKVPASDLGLYEWSGRTFEYHRAQIRTFLGFRECTVADAGKTLRCPPSGYVMPSAHIPVAGGHDEQPQRPPRQSRAAARAGPQRARQHPPQPDPGRSPGARHPRAERPGRDGPARPGTA
jgi:hypothetical protein